VLCGGAVPQKLDELFLLVFLGCQSGWHPNKMNKVSIAAAFQRQFVLHVHQGAPLRHGRDSSVKRANHIHRHARTSQVSAHVFFQLRRGRSRRQTFVRRQDAVTMLFQFTLDVFAFVVQVGRCFGQVDGLLRRRWFCLRSRLEVTINSWIPYDRLSTI
jgi:hypothetical protein